MQNCLYLNRVKQIHTRVRTRSRNGKDEAHEHEHEKETGNREKSQRNKVNGSSNASSCNFSRAATEAHRRRWNVWFLFIECVQSENRKHCFMS